MAAEELIEVKFRLPDGSDIGPSKYSSTTTVADLKEKIVSLWPHERDNVPKTVNDMKLIHAGKILENNKTLAESRSLVSEIPGGVIVMHVVVRPPMADKNSVVNETRYLMKILCFDTYVRSRKMPPKRIAVSAQFCDPSGNLTKSVCRQLYTFADVCLCRSHELFGQAAA
ncbi:Ubiquitin supergroup [Cynara cardunculus var. scolymus]|uniref:Ubiquitin supergroup n=1 Tax=Cynara cardunculus var. scolymus TaxID=59895 RepID=A0A118K4B0_CYNCS|nr:Ubiquitin supergroup [Cynara cardunculus var. scolymus]